MERIIPKHRQPAFPITLFLQFKRRVIASPEKTTAALNKISEAVLKIPGVTKMSLDLVNPKQNCHLFTVGRRKSVLWIYPKKTQAKIVIGKVDKAGKVGKTVGVVDEKGVLVIADENLKITQLVKLVKDYLADRKWAE